MAGQNPLVMIGVPVYNGERYLEEALTCLVNQTYPNIRILVSDNASTDATQEIVLGFAKKYPHIHYHRHDENVGSSRNFNYLFEQSDGEYFMWAAHDDQWDAEYVQACVEKLETNRDAVLCVTDVVVIDENGAAIDSPFTSVGSQGLTQPERVLSLVQRYSWCDIYGLMRRDVLRNTSLFSSNYGTDIMMLLELVLQGEVEKVDRPLFRYRFPVRKTPDEYMKGITGKEAPPSKPAWNTGLSRNLLQTVIQSEHAQTNKEALCEAIVDGVCLHNRQWCIDVAYENAERLGAFVTVRAFRQLIFGDLLTQAGLEDTIRGVLPPLNGRPLLVWGMEKFGQLAAYYLKVNGYTVDGFIDSDPRNWYKDVSGVKIYPPAVLKYRIAGNKPYVLVGPNESDRIVNQIRMYKFIFETDYMTLISPALGLA